MESLIPTFNQVQDILDRINSESRTRLPQIQLPQIVVVGSQSSGKSSVLESLVGQPFLPRGSGITTRCPIILRLVNTPEGKQWCEFDHIPGEQFEDFNLIEGEIRKQTTLIAGTKKNISTKSIKLTIYSPNVLNLTVVDLPGLVEIDTVGQDKNIVGQIRTLVKEVISQQNSIILAVCPANVDIANSGSIRIAKEVDPSQERTIVVLTKLDRSGDNQKDVMEVLKGNVVPIKLGIVGVINRSQNDIDENTPMEAVLQFEKEYLQKHYTEISDQHGIRFLTKKLNTILQKHIYGCFPSVSLVISDLMAAAELRLEALGPGGDLTDEEKKEILVSIIDKFSKRYKAQIDGQSRTEINRYEITGGAKIDYIIKTLFNNDLNSIEPFNKLTDEQILTAVRNAGSVIGSRMINPEVVLDNLIKEEIKRLHAPSIYCMKLAHQEMINNIGLCLKENVPFSKVNGAISTIVTDLLKTRTGITKEIFSTYFKVQTSTGVTANTAYGEFFKELMTPICVVDLGILPLSLIYKPNPNNESNDQTTTGYADITFSAPQLELCLKLKTLAIHVFEIYRRQFQDFIMKSILHSLIFKTVDNVGIELNVRLNKEEKIDALIRESDDIHAERTHLKSLIEEYNEVLQLLDGLRNDAS